MSTSGDVDWVGASGRSYRYYVIPYLMASAIRPDPGNYGICVPNANGLIYPAYFGIAEDFRNRLPTHEKLSAAAALGQVTVMAHINFDAAMRAYEERDLIAFWNPPLNVQHRTVG